MNFIYDLGHFLFSLNDFHSTTFIATIRNTDDELGAKREEIKWGEQENLDTGLLVFILK